MEQHALEHSLADLLVTHTDRLTEPVTRKVVLIFYWQWKHHYLVVAGSVNLPVLCSSVGRGLRPGLEAWGLTLQESRNSGCRIASHYSWPPPATRASGLHIRAAVESLADDLYIGRLCATTAFYCSVGVCWARHSSGWSQNMKLAVPSRFLSLSCSTTDMEIFMSSYGPYEREPVSQTRTQPESSRLLASAYEYKNSSTLPHTWPLLVAASSNDQGASVGTTPFKASAILKSLPLDAHLFTWSCRACANSPSDHSKRPVSPFKFKPCSSYKIGNPGYLVMFFSNATCHRVHDATGCEGRRPVTHGQVVQAAHVVEADVVLAVPFIVSEGGALSEL